MHAPLSQVLTSLHPCPYTHSLACAQVFKEVDNRIKQAERSVTGNGSLAENHVESLAQKISSVIGQKCPEMQRERRTLITNWHRHMQRQGLS